MKRKRFTEEQIFCPAEGKRSWSQDGRHLSASRHQFCDVLQLEKEVWPNGGWRCQAPESLGS